MQLNIKKNSQYHTLWEKCKSKWQEGISSYTSEWPSWKTLQITNAGNSVNKRETSYTAGGEVNWRATTENICKLLKTKNLPNGPLIPLLDVYLKKTLTLNDKRNLHSMILTIPKSESEVAQLCLTLCDPMDTRLLLPWDFLCKSTGVGYNTWTYT